jgi:hypothetical protein
MEVTADAIPVVDQPSGETQEPVIATSDSAATPEVTENTTLATTPSNLTNESSVENLSDPGAAPANTVANPDTPHLPNNKVTDFLLHIDDAINKVAAGDDKSLPSAVATIPQMPTPLDTSALAPPSDISNLLNKTILNKPPMSTKEFQEHQHISSDRLMMDEDLSDLESEGTALDDDEDANVTAEEAQKKLEKILQTSYQNKQQLMAALYQLRGKCHGQDRFWRRYWHLPKAGGIFIEGKWMRNYKILIEGHYQPFSTKNLNFFKHFQSLIEHRLPEKRLF